MQGFSFKPFALCTAFSQAKHKLLVFASSYNPNANIQTFEENSFINTITYGYVT